MKYRDLLKQLHDDGWQHILTTGSHLHYKHPAKPGLVTMRPTAAFAVPHCRRLTVGAPRRRMINFLLRWHSAFSAASDWGRG
ncbi:MAG TPA: type II toxin-antitoxin system HicA family toxin [Tepidisphaeraceae bacterium]|nr:type II toxin-antitoxin system HicA family toxin [Tepidisphaeraceae bacterium]